MRLKGEEYSKRLEAYSTSTIELISLAGSSTKEIALKATEITTNSELSEEDYLAFPYGKNVIGFSNTDAHTKSMVNSSFSVFMMEENNVENIKETMQNGNFFMVTRNLRQNVVNDIGPDEAFDVIDEIGLAYPMFTEVSVDGHKITVSARDADKLQFIANGKVIAKYDIGEDAITLDLDTIEGAEDFLYVRAEILGEGGMTITQALTIDNGSEPLEFVEKTGVEAIWEEILQILSSLRIVVIFQEIIRAF